MKPEPRHILAPTWLIVTQLLGAAVMLYFVTYPPPEIMTQSVVNNEPAGPVAPEVVEKPFSESVVTDSLVVRGLVGAPVVNASIISVAELQPVMYPTIPELDVPDSNLKKLPQEKIVAK